MFGVILRVVESRRRQCCISAHKPDELLRFEVPSEINFVKRFEEGTTREIMNRAFKSRFERIEPLALATSAILLRTFESMKAKRIAPLALITGVIVNKTSESMLAETLEPLLLAEIL
jgi:hypothetical protein